MNLREAIIVRIKALEQERSETNDRIDAEIAASQEKLKTFAPFLDVDMETAQRDVTAFFTKLREAAPDGLVSKEG